MCILLICNIITTTIKNINNESVTSVNKCPKKFNKLQLKYYSKFRLQLIKYFI